LSMRGSELAGGCAEKCGSSIERLSVELLASGVGSDGLTSSSQVNIDVSNNFGL